MTTWSEVYADSIDYGRGQGYFRYFKEGDNYQEIIASEGYFHVDGVKQSYLDPFQTEKPIEGVQFKDKMYFATGTKFTMYDGEKFHYVTPYKPNPLESLYVGTNALAENPDNFMKNGEGPSLRIDGITFENRYSVVNQPITMNVYITKPYDMEVEYKYEYQVYGEDTWEPLSDGIYISKNTLTFDRNVEGDIRIRVWAKDITKAESEAVQSIVPKYKIKTIYDPTDEEVPSDTIHSCNRILLHWNRLIMYGDASQPNAIFVSHLNKPSYFPTPNSLVFESEQRGKITSIVRYRDMLVVFTPSSIQALYGKSPLDFRRLMLNSSIGCIAPYSTAIVENSIAFLSNEGVHFLKSVGYNETRMNVEKIDTKISNLIPMHEYVCGIVYNNQYHLVDVNTKTRFRYYYERDVWAKDFSEKLDFKRMYVWNGELFSLCSDGQILQSSDQVFTDDGQVYEFRIETKYYNFSEPYHPKKLKELQLVMGSQNNRTNIRTKVYADSTLILGADTSYASVNELGEVVWTYESNPRFELESGTTFGTWKLGNSPFGVVETELYKTKLSGRCRHVKLEIIQEGTTPIQFIGLGLKFKTKSP